MESENEMAGCNGHELGETLGDGEGQRGLVCCSPLGCRVGHDEVTEQLQYYIPILYHIHVQFYQYFLTLLKDPNA